MHEDPRRAWPWTRLGSEIPAEPHHVLENVDLKSERCEVCGVTAAYEWFVDNACAGAPASEVTQ